MVTVRESNPAKAEPVQHGGQWDFVLFRSFCRLELSLECRAILSLGFEFRLELFHEELEPPYFRSQL